MNVLPVMLTLAAMGVLLMMADVAADDAPDPARVAEVAPLLPEVPEGVGRPTSDREAWTALAAAPECQAIVSRAERLLAEPLAEQPDELYLEFSQNGNRTRYQDVAFGRRRTRFNTLVLAECLEDRGRFTPAIEEVIAATCAERTWVLPAHDRSLANFNGERIDIDLFSSEYAWQLATVNWLLGDRLSPAIRETLRSNVSERVLEPFRAMYSGEREPNSWMHVTNNWNAVCLACVVGAALAQIEDREVRAEFIAAAEKSSQNFLNGFPPDGYCSEGLGYWNYGFGHYILLAELIYQATDGAVDFMARPGVAAPATFGARIQIIGGVAPSFADCAIGVRPDTRWMHYISRRYGLDLEGYTELAPAAALGTDLTAGLIFAFPNSAAQGATLSGAELGTPERAWFSDAGILVSRPLPENDCLLGVALKGGNNAEHHNHNDVGSYVAVVQDRAVLMDPGSEVYTARTFSAQRYESDILNSWGP
ncbi:MAG TPA: heparinase, partial [Armatimonadetes bacterium]|nr:heparinase [Armatimonadota bacterium]